MVGTEGLFVGAGEGGEELGLVFGVGHGASEHWVPPPVAVQQQAVFE